MPEADRAYTINTQASETTAMLKASQIKTAKKTQSESVQLDFRQIFQMASSGMLERLSFI